MGLSLPLPEFKGLRGVIITGMGGSAIGADLLSAYTASSCSVPLVVHRDYDLPAWANGPQTLVIAASHSGETEETLAAFQLAQSRGCQCLIISTGGKLSSLGEAVGVPVWHFQYTGQPRSAVGFSFSLMMTALYRLGLIPDPTADLRETLHAMGNQQTNLLAEVPVAFNPAKRMAGQLVGRIAVIIGADYMAPVARRWKSQISEVAKAWGQFEFLPEADHNSLAGLNNPDAALSHIMALFITAPENHPRNQIRLDFTRQIFMTQGINTDTIQARGEGRMAHIWTALHFGDYTAYYLAMAYGEDPTPVDAITMLKAAMNNTSQM